MQHLNATDKKNQQMIFAGKPGDNQRWNKGAHATTWRQAKSVIDADEGNLANTKYTIRFQYVAHALFVFANRIPRLSNMHLYLRGANCWVALLAVARQWRGNDRAPGSGPAPAWPLLLNFLSISSSTISNGCLSCHPRQSARHHDVRTDQMNLNLFCADAAMQHHQ